GAVARARRAGDRLWEARSLAYRAFVHLALGAAGRADADFAQAEWLFADSGQELEHAMARHNRGLAAVARRGPPLALSYLDEAGQRYRALNTPMPDLAIDRCAVLLAAGLALDAVQEADAAAARVEREGGQPIKRAELLFAAATAAAAAS